MNFLVRAVEREDLGQLHDLARQFTLLNLPADKKVIAKKIDRSLASFAGELGKNDAEYMFVAVDLDGDYVAGSGLVVAKNGTSTSPNFSFKVIKKERFSRELGIGFIHQILRLQANYDGPTEVGGLVVDRSYRRRPEKIGRMVSLLRFLFIGMQPDRFEKELHAEMAPPLTEEGRSEFWEALGRRFTGMPYQEADVISQQNNQFIKSLFPEEDIYLCLLDSKARLVLGRVAEETQAALHMLNKIGFKYKDEVDPFDGGPHLGARVEEVSLIRQAKWMKVRKVGGGPFDQQMLVATFREGKFAGSATAAQLAGEEVSFPEKTMAALKLSVGEKVFVTPL
ncbi:MAG: arginine N-succinyltransferase [Bdellovibrionales bacterium]